VRRLLATRWGWLAFLAAELLLVVTLVVVLVEMLPNGAAGWAMLLAWLLLTALWVANRHVHRWAQAELPVDPRANGHR
jgi:hypothetical protein